MMHGQKNIKPSFLLKAKNEGPGERVAARDTNLWRAIRHHWNNRKCDTNKIWISL